ncbi:TPA: hypothetical protein ACQTYN_006686 [Pseudomonas aeruginosa]|uniref:hypothetical protein n=1 Tax=Pseudomonas aeruginosa TaxID=287 RepID=UPI000E318B0B|nr:hypothetical protein [Pseudomonas aeruginosa]EJH4826978.1 hypothetical protein [Pseudomonas aeruginosa]EKX5105790.1 hypothetical protein [Pseudomonas aeruginosa]EMC2520340.1 hypothetical protein [Pseudomonas aeruginosa]KAB0697684.1 hypothetical protein F6X67_05485 [Pseudomonas aeruginosa]KAB0728807.1 hypothetical protein F7O90_14555 [Pseudomonas aeruginosa]
MSKHTPGPWYRDGTTVYALNPHNFNRFSAQIHGAHTPKSELEAVAQLMQAAPELLEALEACVARITNEVADAEFLDEVDQARAAIAKATGQ